MIISVMCQPPSPPVRSPESQRVCSHTFKDKGVHHLSANRHQTFCEIDCGQFVFITKVENSQFVPTEMICPACIDKGLP